VFLALDAFRTPDNSIPHGAADRTPAADGRRGLRWSSLLVELGAQEPINGLHRYRRRRRLGPDYLEDAGEAPTPSTRTIPIPGGKLQDVDGDFVPDVLERGLVTLGAPRAESIALKEKKKKKKKEKKRK
jgi:hypothetical protein